MKTFPGLRIVSMVYRLLAVLIGIVSILACIGMDTLSESLAMLLAGGFSALMTYAVGEAILLFLDWHQQQALSTEAQIRLYQELTTKRVIKPLKHARRAG